MAIDCGLSGPTMRATGLKHDMRKLLPYSGYQKIDFDVPVGRGENGPTGDAFDRYMVRMREIEQAVSIIRQALDKLPDGACATQIPRLFKPARARRTPPSKAPGDCSAFTSQAPEKKIRRA